MWKLWLGGGTIGAFGVWPNGPANGGSCAGGALDDGVLPGGVGGNDGGGMCLRKSMMLAGIFTSPLGLMLDCIGNRCGGRCGGGILIRGGGIDGGGPL